MLQNIANITVWGYAKILKASRFLLSRVCFPCRRGLGRAWSEYGAHCLLGLNMAW